ncbi:hypothetical protein BGX38DRAFT_1276808 [Terfezia claveryi]|nr:hypothetical protein BGX38DRAFT_1276808 [Terfezia claveryi]
MGWHNRESADSQADQNIATSVTSAWGLSHIPVVVLVGIGPWVGKGNPVGFLDTENKELIDKWGREQRTERFQWTCENGKQWGVLARTLSILGEDGSEEFKGRDDLSKGINDILEERSEK